MRKKLTKAELSAASAILAGKTGVGYAASTMPVADAMHLIINNQVGPFKLESSGETINLENVLKTPLHL